MKARRFFAYLWRVNAVLILFLGLLAGALLLYAGYEIYKDFIRVRHVSAVSNISAEETLEARSEIGTFEEIAGSTVLRAPLYILQSYSMGRYSKEADSIGNYLFVDPQSRAAYWLKSGMEGVILRTESLPQIACGEKPLPLVASIYVVVEEDSSQDGYLTAADKKSIAVSAPNGTGYRVVAENVDRLLSARLLAQDRLLILYEQDAKLAAAEVNPQPAGPVEIYEFTLPDNILMLK